MQVLENTIRSGLASTEYFAFAAAFDGSRYIDLKFNQHIDIIEPSGYLVKTNIAQSQLSEEARQRDVQAVQNNGNNILPGFSGSSDEIYYPSSDGDTASAVSSPATETPKNRHFNMTAQLDNTRINRDVQRLMEEVISHITNVDGAQSEILLEVNITVPSGLPSGVIRTVSENCRTLKVQSFGFDE